MIRLVVGLGNPGLQYENTRHNIGWMVLDSLSFFSKLNWQKKFKGEYSSYSIDGNKVYFLKPLTFMNLSGESVLALSQFFKIKPHEILVLHDELDIEFGELIFKKGGGLAGHNGLKSMANCLGTQDFYRIRVGISRPAKGSVSSWVLSKFSTSEEANLREFLSEAAKALESCLKNGYDKAAGLFSRKNLIKK